MPDVSSAYKHNRLPQLRGFCYAARSKSISKAAENMFLSQPSVSLQIKALERELGVRLFERRGPRISLTHDGQRLLELAWPLVVVRERYPWPAALEQPHAQFALQSFNLQRHRRLA